jgi:hypothetical protein
MSSVESAASRRWCEGGETAAAGSVFRAIEQAIESPTCSTAADEGLAMLLANSVVACASFDASLPCARQQGVVHDPAYAASGTSPLTASTTINAKRRRIARGNDGDALGIPVACASLNVLRVSA